MTPNRSIFSLSITHHHLGLTLVPTFLLLSGICAYPSCWNHPFLLVFGCLNWFFEWGNIFLGKISCISSRIYLFRFFLGLFTDFSGSCTFLRLCREAGSEVVFFCGLGPVQSPSSFCFWRAFLPLGSFLLSLEHSPLRRFIVGLLVQPLILFSPLPCLWRLSAFSFQFQVVFSPSPWEKTRTTVRCPGPFYGG